MAKSSGTPEAEWDEDKVLSALDHLQNMHIQLRNLRQAMSRVIHPLLVRQSSPEILYSQFSQVATNSVKELQNFTKLIEGDRSQEVLKKARSSRAENPDGIGGWMVTEHPDWLEVKTEEVALHPVVPYENTSVKGETA